jgi:hypothetical protein
MSLFKCLLLIIISQTLPVAYGEARCPGNVASLALRVVQSSLIVVQVKINHSGPYDFVVDTGAQVSTIDPSLATELHVIVQGTTGVGGVATYSHARFAHLDLIEAGPNAVPNSLSVIQEIDQIKAADARIRGILGTEFLNHFDVLIDNRQHILCLDRLEGLASAINSEQIALAEPRGSERDLPFMRPILVSAQLSGTSRTQLLLRLDSGSNVPLLYASKPLPADGSITPAPQLTRVVNGVEQGFAVLPPQNIQIGKRSIKQVTFVQPLNAVGVGPAPREDGLLPTMAFQRVFISYAGLYAKLEEWRR